VHIACPNFPAEEAASLRSLLGLLAPYLRQRCQGVDEGIAEVVLVCLDGSAIPRDLPAKARVAGAGPAQ